MFFYSHPRNIKSTRDTVLHNVGGARISVTIHIVFRRQNNSKRDVLVPDIVTSDKLSRGKQEWKHGNILFPPMTNEVNPAARRHNNTTTASSRALYNRNKSAANTSSMEKSMGGRSQNKRIRDWITF
jgi:hypothetical protein